VITDRPHHLGTPTAAFARQVEFLQKFYRIASLETRDGKCSKNTKVTEPTVVLTFDDGYADNTVNLRAVTEQYGIPVFLFVSTGHITEGTPFGHDIKRDQTGFAPLSWDQVVSLHRTGFFRSAATLEVTSIVDRPTFSSWKVKLEAQERELGERAGIWSNYFSFPWGMPKKHVERSSDSGENPISSTFFAAAGGVNTAGTNPEAALATPNRPSIQPVGGRGWQFKMRLTFRAGGIYSLEFCKKTEFVI